MGTTHPYQITSLPPHRIPHVGYSSLAWMGMDTPYDITWGLLVTSVLGREGVQCYTDGAVNPILIPEKLY